MRQEIFSSIFIFTDLDIQYNIKKSWSIKYGTHLKIEDCIMTAKGQHKYMYTRLKMSFEFLKIDWRTFYNIAKLRNVDYLMKSKWGFIIYTSYVEQSDRKTQATNSASHPNFKKTVEDIGHYLFNCSF